jgi:cell wall-associated NlpC family hydrolase
MPDVAFCRTLKRGVQGDDVRAHKRAISRWNPAAYPWTDFTNYFGESFENAVKRYQRSRNIDQSGVIGKITHESLETAKRKGTTQAAFDATAVLLAKQFCAAYGKTPEEKIRDAIVSAGFYWYSHRSGIRYSQDRPYQIGKPPWVPSKWDCSGYVSVCYYAGGARDPNGWGYNQYGFTGTLVNHGRRVDLSQITKGDLVFYGWSSSRQAPTHVALYVGNQMVLSMGSYPMGHYHYRYRNDLNQIRSYM